MFHWGCCDGWFIQTVDAYSATSFKFVTYFIRE